MVCSPPLLMLSVFAGNLPSAQKTMPAVGPLVGALSAIVAEPLTVKTPLSLATPDSAVMTMLTPVPVRLPEPWTVKLALPPPRGCPVGC